MSIRGENGNSLGVGTLVPRKHSLILVDYIPPITHYGYYAKNKDDSTKFLGRIEIEVDGNGNQIRIEYFNNGDGIFDDNGVI